MSLWPHSALMCAFCSCSSGARSTSMIMGNTLRHLSSGSVRSAGSAGTRRSRWSPVEPCGWPICHPDCPGLWLPRQRRPSSRSLISMVPWSVGWSGNAGRLPRPSQPASSPWNICIGSASSIDNSAKINGDADKDDALRRSLLGTHMIIHSHDPQVAFRSVIDPPDAAREAARQCTQHRCWPVLVGEAGEVSAVLGSPIILYDYPEIAGESTGSLFDATEIDEILMLRVLTMTDAEKAEARATDPKAAEIIERCDAMSAEDLMRLHGTFRDPDPQPPSWSDPDDPFAVFNDHDPETSEVIISGTTIRKGSLVRLHPRRRADAQDVFYTDQVARVTAIHRDLENETHVAVVLLDDPAADLHDWYGRYLYFSPDEVVPL